MPRLSYVEMQVFGEGQPTIIAGERVGDMTLKPRNYSPIETAHARFAISTLLYAQGHFKHIAHDLASGFESRFSDEAARFHAGEEPVNAFFDFDLRDLTERSRGAAALLLSRVERCAEISSRLMTDIGSLPLWRQGITVYGVSEPHMIHVATLTPTLQQA